MPGVRSSRQFLRPAGAPAQTKGQRLAGEHEPFPSEQLLQIIWQRQRLRRDQLTTLDGRTARILHPGFKNHEAGPDFRGAMVQIDGEPRAQGDVEVDLRSSGWRAHGHDRNPAFKNVVLHVIWEGDRAADAEHARRWRCMASWMRRWRNWSAWLGRDSLKSLPDEFARTMLRAVAGIAAGED